MILVDNLPVQKHRIASSGRYPAGRPGSTGQRPLCVSPREIAISELRHRPPAQEIEICLFRSSGSKRLCCPCLPPRTRLSFPLSQRMDAPLGNCLPVVHGQRQAKLCYRIGVRVRVADVLGADCVYRFADTSGERREAQPSLGRRALPAVYRRLRRSGRSPALPNPPSRQEQATARDCMHQAPRWYPKCDKRTLQWSPAT